MSDEKQDGHDREAGGFSDEQGEGLPTGLAQLRAMMRRGWRPPMMELLRMDLSEAEEGRVVFTGRPEAAFYNPMGIVHGGYAATLLDSACGLAAHSALRSGRGFVTLELKVAYHRAMDERTGPVRAIGKLLSMSRKVAFTEASLLDGQDRICASATSTLLRMDD